MRFFVAGLVFGCLLAVTGHVITKYDAIAYILSGAVFGLVSGIFASGFLLIAVDDERGVNRQAAIALRIWLGTLGILAAIALLLAHTALLRWVWFLGTT